MAVDSVLEAVDEPGLRDERSTIVVEKCVDGGGWLWMVIRLIPRRPQASGHSSISDKVVIHE